MRDRFNHSPPGGNSAAVASEAELPLAPVVELISDGFFATTADYVVTAFNAGAERLLGRRREDILGRRLFEAFAEARGSVFEEQFAGVLRDGNAVEFETFFAVSPYENWYGVRAFPLSGGLGVLFRVTTAQRAAETELDEYRHRLEERVAERTRELEESQASLRQAERLAAVGTLAAGLAHELNNPIGAVLLAAQNARLLQALPSAKADFQACLDDIVASAERCAAIISNMLCFAQTKASEKWPTQLNLVVERAVQAIRPYLAQRQAELRLDLAPDLPRALLSPVSIEQVLINLLRNAIESAVDRVHIDIATSATETALRLLVSDDGRGMNEEERRCMFDPFYTTRNHRGGSGLGLSLVHGIVREHGGSIDVRSAPGKGTVFVVDLPKAPGAARER